MSAQSGGQYGRSRSFLVSFGCESGLRVPWKLDADFDLVVARIYNDISGR